MLLKQFDSLGIKTRLFLKSFSTKLLPAKVFKEKKELDREKKPNQNLCQAPISNKLIQDDRIRTGTSR